MEKLPPVNEIVNFLADFDPSQLEVIKRQYPEQADLFLPGMKLGMEDAARDEQAARVTLLKFGLDVVTLACAKRIPELKKQLDSKKGFRSLFSSAKTTTVLGEKMDLRSVYERLVSLQTESENVLIELTIFLSFENYGDVRPFIRQGNKICAEMNKLMLAF